MFETKVEWLRVLFGVRAAAVESKTSTSWLCLFAGAKAMAVVISCVDCGGKLSKNPPVAMA